MAGQRPDHPLQTTELVNQAYLRLVNFEQMNWQHRAHFFAMSARLMRRILVDFARSRGYQKRGAGVPPVSLDEAPSVCREPDKNLVTLDDALKGLSAVDERKSKVVELRYFGGLSIKETAEVLDVSVETVVRDWRLAKIWLLRELSKGDQGGARTIQTNHDLVQLGIEIAITSYNRVDLRVDLMYSQSCSIWATRETNFSSDGDCHERPK
jgi:RNA polymerase sigma factor (TIGR02999 family)